MTEATAGGGASVVRTAVDYLRNPPNGSREGLEFVTEAEEHSAMRTPPGSRCGSPTADP